MPVATSDFTFKPFHSVIRLFMLRVLAGQPVSAFMRLMVDQARVWAFIDPTCRDDLDDLRPRDIKAVINRHLTAASGKTKTASLLASRTPLGRNIGYLTDLLGLEPPHQLLLAFLVLAEKFNPLLNMIYGLEELGIFKRELIAQALDMTPAQIKSLLSKGSPLVDSGLVDVSDVPCVTVSEVLMSALIKPFRKKQQFYSEFIAPSRAASLTLADYPHLENDLSLLHPVMENVSLSGTLGVNVLIYGRPGTGKTELVRALAADLGVELFEVPTQNSDNEALSSADRMLAHVLSQRMLSHAEGSMILFDECEEAIPYTSRMLDFGLSSGGSAHGGKAWMNNLLESNPVPTFWVTNDIRTLDEAYIRRFKFVMKVDDTPRAVRRRIAANYFDDQPVRAEWLDRLAGCADLTPAHLHQAAQLLELSGIADPAKAERLLTRALDNSLQAMGSRLDNADYRTNTTFDPRFINTRMDLAALTASAHRHPHVKLCLYGPPGTGKTAYGYHLAEQLDRPVVFRTAADILSAYVGESEKNIQRMFEQATDEGAVVILDEADSFLADRREASKSWEISQVNQLLMSMERFQGIFVCCTNLMARLDPATLRRFNFKLQFDYLTTDQAVLLFEQELAPVVSDVAQALATLRARLGMLKNMAPGDFANVKRQLPFWDGEVTVARVVGALEQERRGKPGGGGRIGF